MKISKLNCYEKFIITLKNFKTEKILHFKRHHY